MVVCRPGAMMVPYRPVLYLRNLLPLLSQVSQRRRIGRWVGSW
jgi:hypothetical protein